MKEKTKESRRQASSPKLFRPLIIIAVASLMNFGCFAARAKPQHSLNFEIISDISQLPDKDAQACVTNISETALETNGCHLLVTQNFTYKKGAKEFTRQLDKAIPFEKLINSKEMISSEDTKEISFALLTHTDVTNAQMISYSLQCYIVDNQFNRISDVEILRWSLHHKSSRKINIFTLLSQLQQYFLNAFMYSIIDKAIYPCFKHYILDRSWQYFFPASSNTSPGDGSGSDC